MLASGGEDKKVCVWDLEKTAAPSAAPEPGFEKRPGRAIPQLVFSHAGHRASVSLLHAMADEYLFYANAGSVGSRLFFSEHFGMDCADHTCLLEDTYSTSGSLCQ